MKVMVANYISANRELVHENNFDIFFPCDFTIALGGRLVSDFDDKYKVHSLFILSRLSS